MEDMQQKIDGFMEQAEAFQRLAPFRIRFKDESWEMQLMGILASLHCPEFMTRFTTVLGSTVYFPDRNFIARDPAGALRVLAHEVVHLQDAARWGFPSMLASYAFPQILGLGVLLFPLIGWWAMAFLVFLAPWPAPGRTYFEARAYALDVLTATPARRERTLEWAVSQFSGWDYYRMQPDTTLARQQILDWVSKAENGGAKDLMRVLLVYECLTDASWASESGNQWDS